MQSEKFGRTGGVNRRSMMRSGATLALGAAAMTSPLVARAQSGPIKIGLIMPKSGPWTLPGTTAANGARIALEQAGGKVLGRPVEIVWLDEPNPQGAQQNMNRAIHDEKVVAVIGGANSATALGLSSVAKTQKFPLIAYGGAAREITGANCHRYVFRTFPPVPTYSRLMAPLAAAAGKRWYFVIGAYAFGQDVYKSMGAGLKAIGGTDVGMDETPVGTVDFSAYILKIRQAKPDVVILGNASADLTGFVKQFADFGLKDKIEIVGVTVGDQDLIAMGPEAITGVYGLQWHRDNPANPPEDAKLNSAIMAQMKRPAGANDYQGWIAMRLLLAGIEKAGATDPESVVKGLETASLPGNIHFREWDHQLMNTLVAVRARKNPTADNLVEVVDWLPRSPGDMDALHGGRDDIGCRMV